MVHHLSRMWRSGCVSGRLIARLKADCDCSAKAWTKLAKWIQTEEGFKTVTAKIDYQQTLILTIYCMSNYSQAHTVHVICAEAYCTFVCMFSYPYSNNDGQVILEKGRGEKGPGITELDSNPQLLTPSNLKHKTGFQWSNMLTFQQRLKTNVIPLMSLSGWRCPMNHATSPLACSNCSLMGDSSQGPIKRTLTA